MKRPTILLALGLVAGCGLFPGSGSGPTTTQSTAASQLKSNFLAFVTPLTGEEARLGYQTYLAPVQMGEFRELANCLDSGGYSTAASLLRSYTIPFGATGGFGGWLFPDLEVMRGGWTEWDPSWNILFLTNHLLIPDPTPAQVAQGIQDLALEVSDSPEWGIDPSQVEELLGLVYESCDVSNDEAASLAPLTFRLQREWEAAAQAIDESADVADVVDAALGCLSEVRPEFEGLTSAADYGARHEALLLTLDNMELSRISVAYAECMDPLVRLRTSRRLAERNAMVDQRLNELLGLQEAWEGVLSD